MGKSVVTIVAVVGALGFGAWARTRRAQGAPAPPALTASSIPASVPFATSAATSPAIATATSLSASSPPPPGPADPSPEDALMARLRRADPATVLALVREGRQRFPGGAGAEEREARRIDALAALDRIGEAHTRAMIFVQHHPSGPFSQHVMNLMGVHPRPAGAVPEPPADDD
jgi:hypothetical protein